MWTLIGSRGTPGSSPRGRGKHFRRSDRRDRRRIIPARAGKTLICTSAGGVRPDHPRAGGENCWASGEVTSTVGSSPRGRGKQLVLSALNFAARIIPARAGKTSRRVGRACRPDHPRAGGENSVKSVVAKPINGSSPRGRGKRHPHAGHKLAVRIIPARAGKTLRTGGGRRGRGDHPRAGGENGQ